MGKQSGVTNERELVRKLTEWFGENINRCTVISIYPACLSHGQAGGVQGISRK